jgi:hypothetical protein
MSSPILPASGPTAAPARPAAASPTPAPSFQAEIDAAVSPDAFPSSPPPEVLDQVAAAGRIYQQLHSDECALHFSRDTRSGRVSIELRDRAGHTLRTLSAAQALDLAAGRPLE